jgi:hypothetical protein
LVCCLIHGGRILRRTCFPRLYSESAAGLKPPNLDCHYRPSLHIRIVPYISGMEACHNHYCFRSALRHTGCLAQELEDWDDCSWMAGLLEWLAFILDFPIDSQSFTSGTCLSFTRTGTEQLLNDYPIQILRRRSAGPVLNKHFVIA